MIHDKRTQRIAEAGRSVVPPIGMGDSDGLETIVAGFDALEVRSDGGRPFNDYQRLRMNRAWAMRLAPTDAERDMEEILAGSEWWFYVQTPVSKWIVDFYCAELGLIIEVDGGYHLSSSQRSYDRRRDQALNDAGYYVARYWNEELEDAEAVAADVEHWCQTVRYWRSAA